MAFLLFSLCPHHQVSCQTASVGGVNDGKWWIADNDGLAANAAFGFSTTMLYHEQFEMETVNRRSYLSIRG